MQERNVEVKKAYLQSKLKTYQERFDKNKSSYNLHLKIRSIKNSIKIIEKGQVLATELVVIVSEFSGTSIVSNNLLKVSQKDSDVTEAIGIYCKYGLENKVPVRFLQWFIGKKSRVSVYEARTKFTKSISQNVSAKKKWQSFNEYIKQRQRQDDTSR